MVKIDGHNHYQIKPATNSYCLLVWSSHWYLKRITDTQIGLEPRIFILLPYLSLYKKVICSVLVIRGEPSGLIIVFEASHVDPTNDLVPVNPIVNQRHVLEAENLIFL